MVIDFKERKGERNIMWERNIDQLLPIHALTGMEPTTQVCALSENWVSLLLYGTLYQRSHLSRAMSIFIINSLKWSYELRRFMRDFITSRFSLLLCLCHWSSHVAKASDCWRACCPLLHSAFNTEAYSGQQTDLKASPWHSESNPRPCMFPLCWPLVPGSRAAPPGRWPTWPGLDPWLQNKCLLV